MEETPKKDIKCIACLGDSNTYGYDPQSLFGGRYPKEVRWTGRLKTAGYTVYNFGQNGLAVSRRAVHGLLAQELLAGQQDLVCVMLGSNDLLLGLSLEECTQAMRELIERLKEIKAAPRFLLIAPPPFRVGVWVSDPEQIHQSERLPDFYRRLAEEEQVLFADAGEWNIPLAYDGVHFTPEGHELFAKQLAKLLRQQEDQNE